jgi:hypothetical protein
MSQPTLLAQNLRCLVRSEAPLRQIVDDLRKYRSRGTSRDEVQHALESLRAEAQSESEEDRILEILDIVSGFCPPENTVW